MYASHGRLYHSINHIESCVGYFDLCRWYCACPPTIELALWYHDAVYDPNSKDNEERSAELAVLDLEALRAPKHVIQEVKGMILATKHDVYPQKDPLKKIIVDIDLAILGAPEKVYFDYTSGILFEYSFIPTDKFSEGRIAVLEKFLKRENIYHTDFFRSCFEKRARANMKKEISILKSKS